MEAERRRPLNSRDLRENHGGALPQLTIALLEWAIGWKKHVPELHRTPLWRRIYAGPVASHFAPAMVWLANGDCTISGTPSSQARDAGRFGRI
ncbi:hypothetical protein SAMD00023353_0702250 [Rosellinia necatrix]|uniref:Uncharacterized protein n=1 Tax=Rosellinia necatrix TaxID=77044 RepID=A0A1S8A5W3_ROSNE|nr:hypothetical protein SAMD00023353_0702250 [Rosellinia necatrix]